MYRFQRSGQVKNGKLLEAIKWAKEITEFINTKYSQVSLQAYTGIFGDPHTVYWYSDYKDLATLESVLAQLTSDQDYSAIINKGVEFFIDGSFQEKLMSSL